MIKVIQEGNMNKLSEAKLRSNKKWDDNNRERKRYTNKRSTARNLKKLWNVKISQNTNDLLKSSS